MTEITSSIISRVRLWKINHSGPGCSFYKFYEWYVFQQNTRVYIMKRYIAFADLSNLFSIRTRPQLSPTVCYISHFLR